MDDFTKDKLREIRKELVEAHMEYDKRLNKVWEELNKLLKYD
jgi:L-rhamnose mutarotase